MTAPTKAPSTATDAPRRPAGPGLLRSTGVVCRQELRDLWLAGRGLVLTFALSLLLSVTTYLVASNQALNFLEQREAVSLTLQIAVAVGALTVLLVVGDAISGERERDTLESLLLTPAPRQSLVFGKELAALSLWFVEFVVTAVYVVQLGHGVGMAGTALAAGFVVGTLLAVFLAGFGIFVSVLSGSNKISLSVSLFLLIALFAPTQMPSAAQNGWAGDLLLHVDPFTSGLTFLSRLVVDAHSWGSEVGWLTGPVGAAVVATGLAWIASTRLRLTVGRSG